MFDTTSAATYLRYRAWDTLLVIGSCCWNDNRGLLGMASEVVGLHLFRTEYKYPNTSEYDLFQVNVMLRDS